MATCTATVVEVSKTFTYSEPRFLLELTLGEAETLKQVCEMIGGCTKNSRRKHMHDIGMVLRGQGIRPYTDNKCVEDNARSICFKDEPGIF